LGYRISNTAISNDLVNLLGASHYDVNYLEQYLYTEYTGKWNKLGYRVGVGLTNIHNKSAETTQNDWAPTPKLVLSYDLAKNQSLRFSSSYKSQSPSSDMLSPNITLSVPNIVSTGNPYLKPMHLFRNNLKYSFSNDYFDLNTLVFARRQIAVNKVIFLTWLEQLFWNYQKNELFVVKLIDMVRIMQTRRGRMVIWSHGH
jgi:outer membrane receptor protein involved in Fe transport